MKKGRPGDADSTFLQRHKLVKGCGSSRGGGDGSASVTSGGSPPDRSDIAGEDTIERLTPKREP